MKKLPTIVITICIVLSGMLGMMMFLVDSEDAASVINVFNNMANIVNKPVSVTEVKHQMEKLKEDTADVTGAGNSNVTTINGVTTVASNYVDNSTPVQHGNTTFYNTPPQDGSWADDAVYAAGLLQYICQGNGWEGTDRPTMPIWNELLGSSGKRVQTSGCYFTSLSMASAYYRNKAIEISEFQTHVHNSNNFHAAPSNWFAVGDNVLDSYGAGVHISDDVRTDVGGIKDLINQNRPPIIHFTGATANNYYGGSGHYAFIVGYSDSDQSLILYDPGKSYIKRNVKLSYAEYSASSNIYIRTFS